MRIPLLVASLICTIASASYAVTDDDLPVYLRGIGWRNVEAELRKDLRLSPHVHPTHYFLYLDVNVMGYDNAEKSTFSGTIEIIINITAPVREIELHSQGLTIKKATLIGSATLEGPAKFKTLNDNQFQIREERETVAIPSERLLLPGEMVSLQIIYNGTARMNGGGLYESWNQRENSTGLPYISLLTHCEPTRARRWFPCFDEPDKKAAFELSVTHPLETTAYSNTPVWKSSEQNGKRVTQFKPPTVRLPTYLAALAVTAQPVVELTVDGYEFRGIGYNRENAVKTAAEALAVLRNHSVFDGVPFIPEKTEILVVDDYSSGAMENPGLITYHFNRSDNLVTHVHEFTHMYFGNLVTLSTWGDIWVNEGFATFFHSNLQPKGKLGQISDNIMSLHKLPIHSEKSFTSSIHVDNSFKANGNIHYNRSSQVLRMARQFVGAEVFDRAIKKYLLENEYGNGDATKIINNLISEYHGDREQLKKIMYEWIYQPGIAILPMKRMADHVVITQSRFHSSFFNEELRDTHTRFTIPLFCTIDGEQRTFVFDSEMHNLTIPLSPNATFTIENDYGDLFGIWDEELRELPSELEELDEWLSLAKNLFRSGMIDVETFTSAISKFTGNSTVKEHLQRRISHKPEKLYVWAARETSCEEKGVLDSQIDELFEVYLRENDLSILFCSSQVRDRGMMHKWLHSKIVTDELKIRSVQLVDLIKSIERFYPGATMEFVLDKFKMDSHSLQLRIKLREIIEAVHASSAVDITPLHELILLYPSIAAENSEVIMQTLEKFYLWEEFERKDRELEESIRKILNEA